MEQIPYDRDELYDLTAAEVDSEPAWMNYTPPPPVSTLPARASMSPIRFGLWVTLVAVWATLLAAFVWTSTQVVERTVTNWMDGYGLTPVVHVQEISPASFVRPADLTITVPGEEARR